MIDGSVAKMVCQTPLRLVSTIVLNTGSDRVRDTDGDHPGVGDDSVPNPYGIASISAQMSEAMMAAPIAGNGRSAGEYWPPERSNLLTAT